MFFLFPVSVDHRAHIRPLVTLWILGICVFIHAIGWVIWISVGEAQLVRWCEALAFIPAQAKIYTWITSVFLHIGILHLIGNMIYLYLFGACIEDLFGHWRFIVFYLMAGVVATLAHVVWSAKGFASEIPAMGASGAISACMGASAVLLRGMKIELRFVYYLFVTAGAKTFFVPSWLMMSIWFGFDLLGLVASMNNEAGGVAFGAHVGGFLFGLAVAYAVRHRVGRRDFQTMEVEAPTLVALPPPVFVHYNGTQHGPFPVHDVWHQVRNGSIPAEALYWREDLQQWRPVNEL